jgi:hypothetical protein
MNNLIMVIFPYIYEAITANICDYDTAAILTLTQEVFFKSFNSDTLTEIEANTPKNTERPFKCKLCAGK